MTRRTAGTESLLAAWRACALAGALSVGAWLSCGATSLGAQVPTEPATPRACASIVADSERLACYDRAFARHPQQETAASAGGDLLPAREPPTDAAVSLLDSRWELLPESKLGTFGLRAYQPIYVLPWFYSEEPNQLPSSPAPGHTVDDSENLGNTEVKFQISFKTKAWQGVFGKTGDLWIGYTQASHWQLYNDDESRPFRESNYEPEALLVFATDYRFLGWTGRLLSMGINHQSNGRDDPRSRSWNRLIASVGFDRPGWTVTLRPWWRITEKDAADDNPDIEEFVGRADLLVVRHVRSHELTAMLRHSLRGGARSHGAAQVDWAFPIHGNLRGHAQLFRGYGESLIDYNHLTTRIGFGLSLIEWY